jgi:hypothetical protein
MEESMHLSLPGKLPILPKEVAAGKGEWDSEEQGQFLLTSKTEGKRSKGVQFQFPWLVPKKDGNMKEGKWNALDGGAPWLPCDSCLLDKMCMLNTAKILVC